MADAVPRGPEHRRARRLPLARHAGQGDGDLVEHLPDLWQLGGDSIGVNDTTLPHDALRLGRAVLRTCAGAPRTGRARWSTTTEGCSDESAESLALLAASAARRASASPRPRSRTRARPSRCRRAATSTASAGRTDEAARRADGRGDASPTTPPASGCGRGATAATSARSASSPSVAVSPALEAAARRRCSPRWPRRPRPAAARPATGVLRACDASHAREVAYASAARAHAELLNLTRRSQRTGQAAHSQCVTPGMVNV